MTKIQTTSWVWEAHFIFWSCSPSKYILSSEQRLYSPLDRPTKSSPDNTWMNSSVGSCNRRAMFSVPGGSRPQIATIFRPRSGISNSYMTPEFGIIHRVRQFLLSRGLRRLVITIRQKIQHRYIQHFCQSMHWIKLQVSFSVCYLTEKWCC